MRNAVAVSFLIAGSLVFAGIAHSQSLAELAKKEKARRAKIAQQGKETEVVDAQALRRVEGSNFTAVEVKGAPERTSSRETGSARPAPTNPNRLPTTTPTKKEPAATPPQTPTPRAGNTELGRGWSSKDSGPTTGRGWDHRRKEILEGMGRTVTPVHPTTVQERERQRGNRKY